jgi:small subunit ribosomal protein S6
MNRNYELTFIAKPDMDAANLAVLIEKVKGFIAADGGNVVRLDQWGTRRLSYPISKYRDGQYVFVLAEMDAQVTAKVEARLRLQEDVIRYLLVKSEGIVPAAAPAVAAGEAAIEATSAPTQTPATVLGTGEVTASANTSTDAE